MKHINIAELEDIVDNLKVIKMVINKYDYLTNMTPSSREWNTRCSTSGTVKLIDEMLETLRHYNYEKKLEDFYNVKDIVKWREREMNCTNKYNYYVVNSNDIAEFNEELKLKSDTGWETDGEMIVTPTKIANAYGHDNHCLNFSQRLRKENK